MWYCLSLVGWFILARRALAWSSLTSALASNMTINLNRLLLGRQREFVYTFLTLMLCLNTNVRRTNFKHKTLTPSSFTVILTYSAKMRRNYPMPRYFVVKGRLSPQIFCLAEKISSVRLSNIPGFALQMCQRRPYHLFYWLKLHNGDDNFSYMCQPYIPDTRSSNLYTNVKKSTCTRNLHAW